MCMRDGSARRAALDRGDSQAENARMTLTAVLTTDVLPAYRDYLDACNARDWSTALSFVHDPVRVQGVVTSAVDYVAGIARLTAEHPGFVWTVGQTIAEGDHLAARLR